MTELALLELDNPQIIPPDFITPPTQDELLYDDGIPMETYRHKLQMDLLVDPLAAWLSDRNAFVSGNMFVYFSPYQLKNHDFRGPDMFAVLDVPKGERKCWVVWEEGKGPDVVVELLSPSTASLDKRQKKEIYQKRLRVPEYFWFDPFNPSDFAGFAISDHVYQPIIPDQQGRLISEQLGLALVLWSGQYAEANTTWVRWATLEGVLLPTANESAKQAQNEAKQAEQNAKQAQSEAKQAQERAELAEQELFQERQRVENLLVQLRAKEIDSDLT